MRDKESSASKRMGAMLRLWEQMLFIAECTFAAGTPFFDHLKVGAVANWRKLRKAILSSKGKLDTDQFVIPELVIEDTFNHGGTYQYVPAMINSWAHSSRRVYALSQTLQKTLEMTSVGRVAWSDIHPPFPCFAVSLPMPLKWQHGNNIDTIFVELSGDHISMIAIGDEMGTAKFLGDKLKKRMSDALSSRRWGKLTGLLEELRENRFCYIPENQMIANSSIGAIKDNIVPGPDDHLIVYDMATASMSDASTIEPWLPVYRIILGLCLHLEISSRSRHTTRVVSEWEPKERPTMDPNAVTDGELICLVDHEIKLSTEEEDFFKLIRAKGTKEATREMSSHYRSAHWRRKPGKGNDPCADKCVHVRCTLVNQRRLPEDSLPRGVEAEVV